MTRRKFFGYDFLAKRRCSRGRRGRGKRREREEERQNEILSLNLSKEWSIEGFVPVLGVLVD